ncbi:uracil-DNA glycosylase [Entomospira culicis]|uniref:Uracil-DNA glycosylase n=1 Tax=Entomospira culicis TaxID=2719989 RepID=A0A968GGS1_9SPIO|nr:uracil-DNA glycosylase [Entomospira culicis]NIZ19818.1 uracil-DNA glycosylase [Entomospira culicis]NIZ70032.1 uracil-DNA glycosylase [Entomospira culicis]WDI37138.1 uracil-DNA glycosylase [Entomospira culicis]WDI38767.1 uracil-DNA glycosylase [Entomospira culicis]
MNLTNIGSFNHKHHPLNYPVHPEWRTLFVELSEKQWFQLLLKEIEHAYATLSIAPQEKYLWRAFELTPRAQLKGIILGQDPYPNIEYANGLAFSVDPGLTIPASLRNIFFELNRSHEIPVSTHGDLSNWAKQGLLLLNTVLTLDLSTKKNPKNISEELWTRLNQSIIHYILEEKTPELIFMLAMGKKAQKAAKTFLLADNLHIISTPHPSPLAAIGRSATPFIGCGCFCEIDAFLQKHQQASITWSLDALDAQKDNRPH